MCQPCTFVCMWGGGVCLSVCMSVCDVSVCGVFMCAWAVVCFKFKNKMYSHVQGFSNKLTSNAV